MAQLTLSTLLSLSQIDPAQVVILRNTKPSLREVMPYIAAERPDLFRAYQEVQGPRLESALKRASYIASFVGKGAHEAVFVALYQVGKGVPINYDQF